MIDKRVLERFSTLPKITPFISVPLISGSFKSQSVWHQTIIDALSDVDIMRIQATFKKK